MLFNSVATGFSLSAIALSIGAHAAPTPRDNSSSSTPSTSGKVLPNFVYSGNTGTAAPAFTVDTTFSDYVEQLFKNFTVPTGDMVLGQNKTVGRVAPDSSGYTYQIYSDYDIKLSDFAMDNEYVVDREPLLVCNGAEQCSYSVTLSSTTSHETKMGNKLGVSVKAGGKVLGVGLEVGVTAEESEDWSNSTSDTKSTTYEWVLKNGQSCAPATVMFKMGVTAVGEGSIIVSNAYTDYKSLDAPKANIITDPSQAPKLGFANVDGNGVCHTGWQGDFHTIDFCASFYQYYGPKNSQVSEAEKACFWKQSEAISKALLVCEALESASTGLRLDLGPDTLNGEPYILKGCLAGP